MKCEVNIANAKTWAFNLLNLRFPEKDMESDFIENIMFPETEKRAAPYKSILVGLMIAISFLLQNLFGKEQEGILVAVLYV